jgi:hypothetical protein
MVHASSESTVNRRPTRNAVARRRPHSCCTPLPGRRPTPTSQTTLAGSWTANANRFQGSLIQQPDRPSPQSQSLSRSYGSDLPTSLTYIILETRGCSPWRPAADIGTICHENHTPLSDFPGPTTAHRTPRRTRCFTGTNAHISGQADSMGHVP